MLGNTEIAFESARSQFWVVDANVSVHSIASKRLLLRCSLHRIWQILNVFFSKHQLSWNIQHHVVLCFQLLKYAHAFPLSDGMIPIVSLCLYCMVDLQKACLLIFHNICSSNLDFILTMQTTRSRKSFSFPLKMHRTQTTAMQIELE